VTILAMDGAPRRSRAPRRRGAAREGARLVAARRADLDRIAAALMPAAS